MAQFSIQTINNRQKRLQQAWMPLLKSGDTVLVFCGTPITKPGGLDQNYEFIPHPQYYWLTGERNPHSVACFTPQDGWSEFRKVPTRLEKLWDTIIDSSSAACPIHDINLLDQFLTSRKSGRLFIFGECPTDFKIKNQSKEIFYPSNEMNDHWNLRSQFDAVRRIKDAEEIQLIKSIAEMARQGYNLVARLNRVGLSERQIQIEYEAEVYRAGAKKMPYHSIVGAGPNAAILHAKPSSKIIKSNEIILIDAGADVDDYCVDITRVFPAEQKWNTQQKSLVQLVDQAQQACFQMIKPQVAWRDVHIKSAQVMAEGLKSLGVFKSSVDTALESGAMALFYPHGVGHMVGLRVRDVGYEQNLNPKKYFGSFLRVDFDLEVGHVMTVEPGCYFVQSFLQDSEIAKQFNDIINFKEVENWFELGGVRLEDDILVNSNGLENLTACVDKFN